MATDPNQILAAALPATTPVPAVNPFFGQMDAGAGGVRPFTFPQGGMNGLLQAAQSADPNAWSSFLANPWAQHLQQRFGVSPNVLAGLQATLASMNTPHDVRQYFRGNYGQPGIMQPQSQVGMVPGVPGSMNTNAAGQGPVMSPGPGPVITPQPAVSPQQQQQGFRNPMLPAGFAGFGGGGAQAHPPLAGLARPSGAPGFGL